MTVRYLVVLCEFERGWGSKDFHAVGFEEYGEAFKYAEKENARNTEDTAPDYYIQARIETDPSTFHYYEKYMEKETNENSVSDWD